MERHTSNVTFHLPLGFAAFIVAENRRKNLKTTNLSLIGKVTN